MTIVQLEADALELQKPRYPRVNIPRRFAVDSHVLAWWRDWVGGQPGSCSQRPGVGRYWVSRSIPQARQRRSHDLHPDLANDTPVGSMRRSIGCTTLGRWQK